jgi:large subunit ribosomal protein L29
MMKASEIRDWDDVEIRARLEELREERFRLRFRRGTMQLENPKMVQHVRRDVARLNTILRERELTETSEASGTETSQASETDTSEAPETAEQAE